MEIRTTAFPKVNLHLAVGKKREDGFHDIATIYYLVKDSKFKDEITIIVDEAVKTGIEVNGLSGIADPVNNTIYKAVELYLKEANLRAKVEVNVLKGIPTQSGLGGESSDAGAVLNALLKYHPIDNTNLMKIAEMIGSDVPFFAASFDTAIGLGRGEKLEPLPSKNIKITLFPNDEEKMSTKQAYEKLDLRKVINELPTPDELKEMYNQPVNCWNFYNDFEFVNKKSNNPRMKLSGSGTCRYTIDLIEP